MNNIIESVGYDNTSYFLSEIPREIPDESERIQESKYILQIRTLSSGTSTDGRGIE